MASETLGVTRLKNPQHPGKSIMVACLKPYDLTVTEAAKILGVSRQALNNVINGHAAISPEMAFRLSRAFGGTAEVWLRMQFAYQLDAVYKDKALFKRVKGVKPYKEPRISVKSKAKARRAVLA
ncbi:MAG: HigA family addiction module antidote protein [Nitrospinae bacterium]|nr:HigA family addiction module antidote protein [Nitrospinota bacterium]